MVVFVRAIVLYIFVVVVMRKMGKRQIGELQPFELVIAIMLSELAAVPMQDTGIPLLHGIIPILTLLLLEIIISYITLKSRPFRKIVCGTPSILIEHGKVVETELAKQRFDLDDLIEGLRILGYLNISDIEYAILETNGKVSVVPKFSKSPVTREDMQLQGQDPMLPIGLILDGKLNKNNLRLMGYDESWLYNQLSMYKINKVEDVFIGMFRFKRSILRSKEGRF